MREAGVAALAMTEAGDAAPATTGAKGALHPLFAVAVPPPLTGMHCLTINRCQLATVCMHSSRTASVIALDGQEICIEQTMYMHSLRAGFAKQQLHSIMPSTLFGVHGPRIIAAAYLLKTHRSHLPWRGLAG